MRGRVESRPNSTPYNLSFFELNGVAREQATKVAKVQVKRVRGEEQKKKKKRKKKKERVQTVQTVQAHPR